MKITLKLFAMLHEKPPPESNGKEMELEVAEGTTPHQIIELMDIPKDLAHLVMVNGYHLLPEEIAGRPLKAGEALAIFPPVAGG